MAKTDERVKVKRGKSTLIPAERESGSIIIETDTGATFVDNSDTERIQLKDTTKLPLTGGTVTGDIDLGDNNLTTTHEPSDDSDVVNKKYVDENSAVYTGKSPIIVEDDVISHAEYGEQSGGPEEDEQLDYSDSFIVTYLESDSTGHVKVVSDKELTLPDIPTEVESATKLSEANTIDGVEFDGTSNIVHYGSCTTAAGTQAKTVSCNNFVLDTGASIKVIFSNTNTAESPTLNVNSTGEKSIYTSNGEHIVTNYGTLLKDTVYEFIYDGTQYYMVTGPLNRVDTVEDNQTEFRNCIVVEPGVDLDELDVPVGTMIMVKEESSIPASKVAITYDQTTETLKIFDEE